MGTQNLTTDISQDPWNEISFNICRWGGYLYLGPIGIEWTNTETEYWKDEFYQDWGMTTLVWKNKWCYTMGWDQGSNCPHWFFCRSDRFTSIDEFITYEKIKKAVGDRLNKLIGLFKC